MNKPFGREASFRFDGLPYCLYRCADGRWLVIARSYKPVGVTSSEWVDYDTCDGIRLHLTPKQLEALGGINDNKNPDARLRVSLYNDATNPQEKQHRAAYFAKLAILIEARAE